MKDLTEQLFKIFKHISRDLLFYSLSGFIVILNIAALNFEYWDNTLLNTYLIEDNWFSIFVISLVIGHVLRGIILNVEDGENDDSLSNELITYIKHPELYEQFIERYNQLFFIRRNLAFAFISNVAINIIVMIVCSFCPLCCDDFSPIIIGLTIISLISGWRLYCLQKRTKKDMIKRVEVSKKVIEKE